MSQGVGVGNGEPFGGDIGKRGLPSVRERNAELGRAVGRSSLHSKRSPGNEKLVLQHANGLICCTPWNNCGIICVGRCSRSRRFGLATNIGLNSLTL